MALLMTPIQTAGLNQIPTSLSAHGSAIWNTIRQVAGAVGTSLLVTVMATSSEKHVQELITSGETSGLSDQAIKLTASIHGINVAYFVIIIVGVASLLLSFFINNASKEDNCE